MARSKKEQGDKPKKPVAESEKEKAWSGPEAAESKDKAEKDYADHPKFSKFKGESE